MMIDIKALESAIADAINHPSEMLGVCLTVKEAKAVLALLKEQETVKPVMDIDTWKCGNCGHTLEHQELLGDNVLFHEQYNYCPECGRRAPQLLGRQERTGNANGSLVPASHHVHVDGGSE